MSAPPLRQPLDPVALARLQGLQLRVRRAMEGLLGGLHASRHKGSSIEFQEHKEYSPGDEIRHIDWKAYARLDRYTVKQFEQETNLRAYLLVDASGSMGYASGQRSKLDCACELAATLAHLLLNQQDAAGLLTLRDGLHDYIPPRSGSGHLLTVTSQLAQLDPKGPTDLVAGLRQVAELARRSSLIVLLSDLFDFQPELLRLLRQLRGRRHEVVVLQILDPAELSFPFTDLTLFEDMEGPRELLADPRAVRDAYLEELERFLTEVRMGCREADIDHLVVDTAQDSADVLRQMLARGRR